MRTIVTVTILAFSGSLAARADERPAQSGAPSTKQAVGTGDELDYSLDEATTARLHELIAKLGSPEYRQREEASTELRDFGTGAFEVLRLAYHRIDDVDVRLRIEKIVHTGYIDHYVYDRNGFLGISQDMRFSPTHSDDTRIPEGHTGIRIAKVHDDTAASRGGLRQNDLVIAFDGEPIMLSGMPWKNFGDKIRRRRPGERATLTILRGNAQLELEVTLGRWPAHMVEGGSLAQAVTGDLLETRKRFNTWWTQYFRRGEADREGD